MQQGRAGDGQLAINPVAVHRVQPGLCQQAAHIAFPCAGRPVVYCHTHPGFAGHTGIDFFGAQFVQPAQGVKQLSCLA